MQFLVIRKARAMDQTGIPPTQARIDALTAYVENLAGKGLIKAGGWLGSLSDGARVVVSETGTRIMDGPFAESKEVIAGFAILDVPSLEDAVAIVKEWPVIGTHQAEFDIRQIMSPAELGFSAQQTARYERIIRHEVPKE